MNTMATIGFGSDATLLAGGALASNERLGTFGLLVEVPVDGAYAVYAGGSSKTQTGSLWLKLKVHDGVTAPSGYYDVAGPFQVVAGGKQFVQMAGVNSKRLGFFGSGNVKANISVILPNPAVLAGQDISLVNGPRAGWGFQDGSAVAAFTSPGYPPLPLNSN
jgi:hypothetical protein